MTSSTSAAHLTLAGQYAMLVCEYTATVLSITALRERLAELEQEAAATLATLTDARIRAQAALEHHQARSNPYHELSL